MQNRRNLLGFDRRMALNKVRRVPAKTIMKAIAAITAAIMISTWSTMPMAVITESNEKTASNSRICTITPVNVGATLADARPSSPSRFS